MGRVIEIEAGDKRIYIPINNKVTIITGDSATGKTKMVKLLQSIKAIPSLAVKSSINIETLEIIDCADREELDLMMSMSNAENRIFIMDKYDALVNRNDIQKLVEFIQKTKSLFIIIAHNDVPKCGYNHASILYMEHDGYTFEAKRYFQRACDMVGPNNFKQLF